MSGDRRGQVVLIAAAVIALALVPALFAYLQLGYHADVTASEGYDRPVRDAERTLERAVHDAGRAATDGDNWGQRRAVAREVRDHLDPRFETLASARVESGTVYEVRYNQSAARSYATDSCPSGPARRFGPCRAVDGVVLQQRAGETHVLAVAVDLSVTGERRQVEETVVVRVVGGVVG